MVTLLSASFNSELLFCKTTLLRKQLVSAIPFGSLINGKKDVALLSPSLTKATRITVPSRLAFFTNCFSKLFAHFREVDLFRKLLKRCFISFTLSLITVGC